MKLYSELALVDVLGELSHSALSGDGAQWYQSQLALLPKCWRDNFGGPTPVNMWALSMVQDDPITKAALRGAYELIHPAAFEVYALTFQKRQDVVSIFRVDEATGLIGSMVFHDGLRDPVYLVNSMDVMKLFGVADPMAVLKLARSGDLVGRNPFAVERVLATK